MDVTIAGTAITAAVAGTTITATVTETVTSVSVASNGPQGAPGASGVVGVVSPITNTGTIGSATIGHAASGVNAGYYGAVIGSVIPTFTVDTTGHITSAVNQPIAIAKSQVNGTAVTLADTGTVSNTMLAKSTVTFNGQTVALGGTATITIATADYATLAGTATYAGSALTAGTSSYATLAGTAVFSSTSGTASYATTSGTAVFASSATSATTAGSATNAGSALTAGTASYATLSGTTTYATTAGTAVNISGTISPSQTLKPVVDVSSGVGAVYFCNNPASGAGSALTIASKVATWIINHNIGRNPLTIQVVSATGMPLAVTGYGYVSGRQLTNTVTSVARSAGSTTATISSVAHGLSAGDIFSISGTSAAGISGVFTVLNVISADQFTYTSGATTATSVASGVCQIFKDLNTYATVRFGTSAASFSANQFRAVLIG